MTDDSSTQKVILTDGSRGRIWYDNAPIGDELTLQVTTTYRATGEIVRDGRWGEVRFYEEIFRVESLTPTVPRRLVGCPGCGSQDHTHNIQRHQESGIPVPKPGQVWSGTEWIYPSAQET